VVRLVTSASKLVEAADNLFRDQLVSAFSEAFNNVALHAYRGRVDGRVELAIEYGEDWITVRMVDTGQAFDPTQVSSPDLSALPESGMGLFIIRSFMDELSYRPGPPNLLSMTKRVR
jgi:serine/threonine-protein kinase RsbW